MAATSGSGPEELAALLRPASRIFLFTGAGISTGSGIPDFRGPQGVWKTRRPVYYHDFLRSEEARVEHWDFKLEGWPLFRDAAPTPAHDAIAALERAGKVGLVVTQNVDGLHARAGTSRSAPRGDPRHQRRGRVPHLRQPLRPGAASRGLPAARGSRPAAPAEGC